MKLGIVGLPNVGKSTLFNSMTLGKAEAANYPFCTIDPNVGVVAVPDKRLDRLTALYNSAKTTPAVIEFVDIAGLVKGASKGEGLGNKFLSHIREVDAIVHVVRCFEDANVVHVDGSVDPVRDIETINLELIFSDLEILERRIAKTTKSLMGNKSLKKELDVLKKLQEGLEKGICARMIPFDDPDDAAFVDTLDLLTSCLLYTSLGRIARLIAEKHFKKVSFGLHGSFADTYKGHGTDIALVAGALGMYEYDERLSQAFEIAKKEGIEYEFYKTELDDMHENSVKITFTFYDGTQCNVWGSSIGGGQIKIVRINEFDTEFNATAPTLIVNQYDKKGVISNISKVLFDCNINIAVMKLSRTARGKNACTVIETDGKIPENVVNTLRGIENIISVQAINV